MYRTFCVNLDRDTKKWDNIQKTASWKVERFSAVNGREQSDIPSHMSPFMYGCLMSHRALWQIVVELNEPCLILEDDAMLYPEFPSHCLQLMRTCPSDVDVAVLGHSGSDVEGDIALSAAVYPVMRRRKMGRVSNSSHWWCPGFFIGTHCYIVTPKGAQKLLDNPEMYHADAVISRNPDIRLYTPMRSLVSQASACGLMYNRHVTFEWLLSEPIVQVGPVTLRSGHLIAAYTALLGGLFLSRNETARTIGWASFAVPVIHYFGTKSHLQAGLARVLDEEVEHAEDTDSQIYQINDALSASTVGVLLYTAHSQGKFHGVTRLYLVLITLKMIISSCFVLPDPSGGRCDARSLGKNTIFDFCGDLFVSGHMLPSLVLAKLSPTVGYPLASLQAFTILKSKSHHFKDIVWSVVLVQATALMFKELLSP